jgi:membrane protease subunit HflC
MRRTFISSDHDHDDGLPHDHGHEDIYDGPRLTAKFWKGAGVLVLLAIVGIIAARTIFFVDETEYVYVTQFGQPLQLYIEPGLKVKWPYQSVWRFDRRLQMYDPPAREMLTEDKENLNFDWYVCWRIPSREFVSSEFDRPGEQTSGLNKDQWTRQQTEIYVRRFLQSVGTVETAESRLEERVQAAIAAEIGRTRLTQLVSLDPSQVQLEPITARVTDAIRTVAAEQFGIEVVDVRLKRFNYPEAVKPAVFAEIRSERERVAVQYRAEGARQKTKIESLATLQRDQLLAQAKREATRIRGEGEAKAIEISNAAHSKNPEFYELLKTLETYQSILDDQTTVVLSADSPLLKLLTRGLPSLTNPPGKSPSGEVTPVAKEPTTNITLPAGEPKEQAP